MLATTFCCRGSATKMVIILFYISTRRQQRRGDGQTASILKFNWPKLIRWEMAENCPLFPAVSLCSTGPVIAKCAVRIVSLAVQKCAEYCAECSEQLRYAADTGMWQTVSTPSSVRPASDHMAGHANVEIFQQTWVLLFWASVICYTPALVSVSRAPVPRPWPGRETNYVPSISLILVLHCDN